MLSFAGIVYSTSESMLFIPSERRKGTMELLTAVPGLISAPLITRIFLLPGACINAAFSPRKAGHVSAGFDGTTI